MRVILSVLAAVLLVGCAGPERTTQDVPFGADDSAAPTDASTITVQASAPAGSTFSAAARLIQRQGYGIESSNSELKTLTTTWKTLEGGMGPNVSTKLSIGHVSSSPTRLQVSGTFRASGFEAESIRKRGQSGSATRRAWAEMLSVAYHFSKKVGGKLSFSEAR